MASTTPLNACGGCGSSWPHCRVQIVQAHQQNKQPFPPTYETVIRIFAISNFGAFPGWLLEILRRLSCLKFFSFPFYLTFPPGTKKTARQLVIVKLVTSCLADIRQSQFQALIPAAECIHNPRKARQCFTHKILLNHFFVLLKNSLR